MLRYAITDGTQKPGGASGAAPVQQVAGLARLGVHYVQVREKHMAFAEQAALASALQSAIARAGGTTRVLLSAPATPVSPEAWPMGVGIHLSTAALPGWTNAETSSRHASGRLVSASCHSVEEALRAATVAQILLFAPVFEKRIRGEHVCKGAGLGILGEVCRAAAPLPVLAMGGVDWENAGACMEAGAAGVAGIRLFQQEAFSEGE